MQTLCLVKLHRRNRPVIIPMDEIFDDIRKYYHSVLRAEKGGKENEGFMSSIEGETVNLFG